MGLDLSALYDLGIAHYLIIAPMLIIVTGLKAYIAYWVVLIFKELKIELPFSRGIYGILIKISQIAFWTGILSVVNRVYSHGLMKEHDLEIPIDWAHEEILFFAGVIYLIALVFKRGMELQSENELTV